MAQIPKEQYNPAVHQYCGKCGEIVFQEAEVCPSCGVKQKVKGGKSKHSKGTLALICFFLGCFGVHRFMVGKAGTGILMLCTLGCFTVWMWIDFIIILMGNFTDKDGNKIE